MQSANNITNLSAYEDMADKIMVIENNVSNLRSYTVSKGTNGTNFGVRPSIFSNLSTGMQNTSFGDLAAGGPYTVTTRGNNTFLGYNAGLTCEDGSNNTFLSCNVQLKLGQSLISGSIALGSNAIINNYNQLMVAPTITSFNISGLTTSMGTGEGTIREYDSAGNIIPSTGTYNTGSKIDSTLSAVKNNYIFFTYDRGVFNYTIPDGINLINIEAAGGGATGNSAINSGATNEGGTEIWEGGGGGGLGQFGSITIPVSARGAFEFSYGLGGVDSSMPTPATATTILYNGALVLTCNGANTGSGMNGGSGMPLAEGVFNMYSCSGRGGMNIDGGKWFRWIGFVICF